MAKVIDQANGEEPKPKKPMGRPSQFKPEYIEQVEKLCRMGATDPEMAEFFSVSIETIYNWREKHADFLDAIKRGRVEADMKVAQSLYDKAIGGDTTAQIFWLKNRRAKTWRDTKDVNQTNEDGPNRAKATAEDRSRTLELLGRLGLGLSQAPARSREEQEGTSEFSILRPSN